MLLAFLGKVQAQSTSLQKLVVSVSNFSTIGCHQTRHSWLPPSSFDYVVLPTHYVWMGPCTKTSNYTSCKDKEVLGLQFTTTGKFLPS